jgi:hypothetical protein
MGVGSPLGTITLGLYPTECAAHRAAVEFRRKGPSAGKYPAILAELQARGVVVGHLLPKWVRAVPGGYTARRVTRAGVIEAGGPFDTPAAAFLALYARLPSPKRPESKRPQGRHHKDAELIARRYQRGERVEDLADEYQTSHASVYRLIDRQLGEGWRVPGRPWHPLT